MNTRMTAEEIVGHQDKVNKLIRAQAHAIDGLIVRYLRILRDPTMVVRYDDHGAMIIHASAERETILARVDVVGTILENGDGALEVRGRTICTQAELEALCDLNVLAEDLH